jgi:hypothetical protein
MRWNYVILGLWRLSNADRWKISLSNYRHKKRGKKCVKDTARPHVTEFRPCGLHKTWYKNSSKGVHSVAEIFFKQNGKLQIQPWLVSLKKIKSHILMHRSRKGMKGSAVANPSCFRLCTVFYYNCGPKYFRKKTSSQHVFSVTRQGWAVLNSFSFKIHLAFHFFLISYVTV